MWSGMGPEPTIEQGGSVPSGPSNTDRSPVIESIRTTLGPPGQSNELLTATWPAPTAVGEPIKGRMIEATNLATA